MVNENAGKVIPNSFMDQKGANRRINTAGKGAKDLLIPYFAAESINAALGKLAHIPIALATADAEKEVFDHIPAFGCSCGLGMILHTENTPVSVFESGNHTFFCSCGNLKAQRYLNNISPMLKATNRADRNTLKQRA